VYWFVAIDIGLHLIIKLIVQTFRSPAGAKFFHRHVALATIPRHWHVVDKSQDQLIMEHELFRHIEMEVFVSRENLAVALSFLREAFAEFDSGQGFSDETRVSLAELDLPNQIEFPRDRYTHHYPVCIRRVLPDDTLITASSGGDEDYYALSLISYARPDERQGFFVFCNFVAPAMNTLFAARCHWGKYCPSSADAIRQQYPRLAEFHAVGRKFDPNGRFRNDWLRDVLRTGDAN
jgi:L-gulono-1,4-lactone dehydrogenase